MASTFPPPAREYESTSKLRVSLNRLAATLPKPTVCEQAVHEAIKASERAFKACRLIGYQRGLGDQVLELRNCIAPGCGSTLAVEVETEVH